MILNISIIIAIITLIILIFGSKEDLYYNTKADIKSIKKYYKQKSIKKNLRNFDNGIYIPIMKFEELKNLSYKISPNFEVIKEVDFLIMKNAGHNPCKAKELNLFYVGRKSTDILTFDKTDLKYGQGDII